MDFPATERTQQFYGHGDPAREAVAGKYSSSSFYEESHSSTPGAEVGEGDCLTIPVSPPLVSNTFVTRAFARGQLLVFLLFSDWSS